MAKTVVTQIMFRRFEVTTGNNPDRSGGFNCLAFLRGLLCCRITGFLAPWLFLRARAKPLGVACLGKVADATDETLNSVG
jgi:hypothetical protein